MIDISKDTLRLASGGNVAAFEEIYKETSGFVYNVALRVSRNRADSEEITQEVFMKIYHNLKNFQFRSSFKTWVYRITVNAAINRYRQSTREVENKADYKIQIETFSSGHKAAEGIIQSDNEEIVSALLETLIPEHKTCLILRELEGLSYQDISSVLKIPINTVRSRLKRAREALLIQAKKRQVENEV
ncbi:MAG: RNA polymerase sigma factor [Candidatus Omnitrophota bacterium]|jgi:RNA polymerase sigma-70 factor (ECF subfamily)